MIEAQNSLCEFCGGNLSKVKEKIIILYEDDWLIAVNKPPRAETVPSPHAALSKTALGIVQCEFEARGIKPYVLHRLDAQTSGVLMFGKHERDRARLEEIFTLPDTRKTYIALVKGAPRAVRGEIAKPIEARSGNIKIPALTVFKIIKHVRVPGAPPMSLVSAEIKTGRKHQIRKHFASIGCPVIMDGLYGDMKFNRNFRLTFRLGRLALHAASVEFTHPFLAKKIRIEAPLPPDLVLTLKRLRITPAPHTPLFPY